MKWEEIGEFRCSVARTLSVIGDRWTLMILRDAFMGLRKFEDFQRDLGITRHLLSERLRKLVRHRQCGFRQPVTVGQQQAPFETLDQQATLKKLSIRPSGMASLSLRPKNALEQRS